MRSQVKTSGLDSLQRRLRKMEAGARRLHGRHEVRLSELLCIPGSCVLTSTGLPVRSIAIHSDGAGSIGGLRLSSSPSTNQRAAPKTAALPPALNDATASRLPSTPPTKRYRQAVTTSALRRSR